MKKIKNIFDEKTEENPALENSIEPSFFSKFWIKIKSKFKRDSE